ncbi:MAG: hypothetical protein ACOY45_08445 [Pseudomonadota bacterium]
MAWLTALKFGLKFGLPALALAFLGWATVDRFRLAETVDRYRACTAQAAGSAQPDACDDAVALRVNAARRAAECESALGGRDLYAIRAACGEQVKRRDAEASAAEQSLADARAQLVAARAETAAAVERAEARATAQTNRIADNDRTISQAPRLDDGRVRCDAECLRRLSGPGTAAKP